MEPRTTQQFVKGQTILHEGTLGDRTYKIVSGEVVICKKSSGGSLVPLAKLGSGEIFGEMYLFDPQKARTATAIAVSSEVKVEVLFQDELQDMLGHLSPSTHGIFEGMSKRLSRTSKRYADMIKLKPATQLPDGSIRTGEFIKRHAET